MSVFLAGPAFVLFLLAVTINMFRPVSCRRVHISNKTLQYIGGEFEVEPAFGEKREDALRAAGLKTYFISKVLCPVSQGE